ncbi:hypothetical protein ACFOY8_12195 [Thalassospira xianhensis]|uniref:Uncharacterized protein n=1 Tax=Thalassospira xianhensis MCCC 1A02616 TaxID=1177929 RepID=A0A367UH37_9PROT|nr:hypothetical protein [Thalassospira xianhensis]RCK06372.1 hypothetical protein TH5_09255 [Thalassospira xianhensis MCCC 1A02616]
MSRLVPALPTQDNSSDEFVIRVLESTLDDTHVVFQKGGELPGYLVAHPTKRPCCVIVVEEMQEYDFDSETFGDLYLPDIADGLALSFAGRPNAILFLKDTPRPDFPTDPNILFQGELDGVGDAVSSNEGQALGEEGMAALFRRLAPRATPYKPGEVTGKQLKWRSAFDKGTVNLSKDAVPTEHVDEHGPKEAVQADVKASKEGAVQTAPVATLVGSQAIKEPVPDIKEDDPLILLIRNAVENRCQFDPIYVAGVQLSHVDVAAPDFLLPALLISAAEDWAPVVASNEGKGGFYVRLRTDPNALMGYKVVSISPATKFLLMMPIIDKLSSAQKDRTNEEGVEYLLDDMVLQFTRWLAKHHFDTEFAVDIDVRVAFSV